MVKELGIICVVVSAEANKVVKIRCEKLKIDCIHGCEDKLNEVKRILKNNDLSPENAVFVGNDVGDYECMKYVGIPIAVADAYPQIKEISRVLTKCEGGKGAVREVCEMISRAILNNE